MSFYFFKCCTSYDNLPCPSAHTGAERFLSFIVMCLHMVIAQPVRTPVAAILGPRPISPLTGGSAPRGPRREFSETDGRKKHNEERFF